MKEVMHAAMDKSRRFSFPAFFDCKAYITKDFELKPMVQIYLNLNGEQVGPYRIEDA